MEENGRWVTVHGAHVFIKDGEEPKFGGKLQKTVPEEHRYDPDYKQLEEDVNGLMEKDYDEGTFLSVRARIIEQMRKAKDSSKYDVLLGKFERDAQRKFGLTSEDMQLMAEQGTHTKVFQKSVKERTKSWQQELVHSKSGEVNVDNRTYKKVGAHWEEYKDGQKTGWKGNSGPTANRIVNRPTHYYTDDIDDKIKNATDHGSSLEYRDIKNSMAMESEFQKRYKNFKPRKATGKEEKLPWE